MPTEAELRDLLHGDEPDPGALDSARIIRQARARRRPKQLAAALAGGVAAVGAIAFAVPAVLGLGVGMSTTSGGSAADQGVAGDDASVSKESDADESASALSAPAFPACGTPLAEPAPDPDGLVLRVSPVDASAGTEWIETTVTLTNEGDSEVTGVMGSHPRLIFAADGAVLWYDDEPHELQGVPIELQPGETQSYPATFRPVECDPSDVSADGFAADLPAADPGTYTLTATVDILDPDTDASRQITGPATAITLQ